MKSKRTIRFLVVLFLGAAFAQKANAIPVGGTFESSHSELFTINGGQATVYCEVYSYGSGQRAYTYQISNSSNVGLSFFSVGIQSGATVLVTGWDSGSGMVDPYQWAAVGTPVQSVDAIFFDTVDNDGKSSAVLWFTSDYSADWGNAALFGTSAGVPHYATGQVYTPLPEPATIFLLGAGGAVVGLTRRRRLV